MNRTASNIQSVKSIILLIIVIIISLLVLSCSYKTENTNPFLVKSIDTLYLMEGYEDIVINSNTINLCDPVAGEIAQYTSRGLNTITLNPYSQIRFTDEHIYYISNNDWKLHITDYWGKELSVKDIPSYNDYYCPLNMNDYISFDPSSGEIYYKTGSIVKTHNADRLFPFYDDIDCSNSMIGIKEDDNVYTMDYKGQIKHTYEVSDNSEFALTQTGIITLENSSTVKVYTHYKDSTVYESDDYYTDIDYDNYKAVIYNRQTGQTVLIRF